MQKYMFSGSDLHELFSCGYRNLKKNMDAVNNLNVFPVPDGDTGTNMVQTFGGGLRAVSGEISHAGEYMQKLSKAVLLSARGNSGVIFSQFVHGLSRGFADKAEVCFADFACAFACAKEDAYKEHPQSFLQFQHIKAVTPFSMQQPFFILQLGEAFFRESSP